MERQGAIIAIVGPSGAGKDTLIEFARNRLSNDERFGFVQRCITRPAEAGGEAHAEIDEREFEAMKADGAFALWWRAHGLCYGIPSSTISDIEDGKTLIVNGSRSAIPAFRDVYGNKLKVALITAPKDVLAARLSARGRESAQSILARLERKGYEENLGDIDITIVNNRSPEDAGHELVDFLIRTADDANSSESTSQEDIFPFPSLIRH